jgi:hypothetical protein
VAWRECRKPLSGVTSQACGRIDARDLSEAWGHACRGQRRRASEPRAMLKAGGVELKVGVLV